MAPQIEYIGSGSVGRLREVLARHAPRKVFLVTGRDSYESSGARAAIEPQLGGCPLERYSDFALNPNAGDVDKAVRRFREAGCDMMIAAGGGSVMDMAKTVRIVAAQGVDLGACLRDPRSIASRGVPLVAIPTTAGSGSQATRFSVIYVGPQKHSLEHEFVRPDYAIVDPDLTLRLSPRQTAISGLDALAQAMESCWSVLSTDESREYARRALVLALNHLERAVNHPDAESRAGMAEAAHLAGKAINISKTTACHAISYPMTSHFNVPHGLAVAITLPSILCFNSDVTAEDVQDPRGDEWVRGVIARLSELLGGATPQGAASRIEVLIRAVGMPTRLGELNIRANDLPVIIANGFSPARMNNNPRRMTAAQLETILKAIL